MPGMKKFFSPRKKNEPKIVENDGQQVEASAYIARQPIFDRNLNVFAYELLFRSGLENFFDNPDGNQASSKVIADTVLLFGIEKMTGGKKAFINFTHDILVANYALLLPHQAVVIELLEDITPDEEVQAVCQKLRQSGYEIALDDFSDEKKFEPLLGVANILKIDFDQTTTEVRKHMVDQYGPKGIDLLAEKVETREEFEQAFEMGYQYFQGYFFSKPIIIQTKDIPSSKLNYLRIIREVNKSDLDFESLEDIIKNEIALSYKLLRYLNSAFFGLRVKVSSIRQALALLGEKEIKKWVTLVTLANMGQDKPDELVSTAIARGKFCELVSPEIGFGNRSSDFFLLGMFSVIDALIDRPLPEILNEISLIEDVEAALLGEDNKLKQVFDLNLSYEKGEWKNVAELSTGLKLDEAKLPALYLEAVEWANEIFKAGVSAD
jgi:c-di-GMP-related signal transduction protein